MTTDNPKPKQPIETPWGPLGYITYKRTYSRNKNEDPSAGTEEYTDTIDRIMKACDDQLNVGFTDDEKKSVRQYFMSLKCSTAGRFLWQLGTHTVEKLGLLSLQNCAFTTVDEPVRPFTWAFDALMLGSGVGYNIQREFVYEIPKVKVGVTVTRKDTNDADFIVPDSREGWVELLQRTLEAFFVTGKSFSYSVVCIRSKGSPIKGFGGTASGPEELCRGIGDICGVLHARAGKKMRPIDCLDIMNIIGYIVVSGNVRRSAQIAIGDFDDRDFLKAKRWDLGSIPNWRAMSNNSVVCNDFSKLPEEFWDGYIGKGEPYGLINLKLSRKVGRLGDERFPDKDVCGFNPCAEQSLNDKETCALGEVFLPNITSKEELQDVVNQLYRIIKHSLILPCHLKETEKVVHKNMRMGIGVTGYLQATAEQKSWLPDVYEALRAFDKEYSAKHGWNESIKLTTCKPSGTLSLLAGVTSGIHPGYSRHYIRRIRISSSSPLVALCRSHGYAVEYQKNFDGTEDHNLVVVSFPCKHTDDTVIASDLTAIDQMEWVKKLQTDWSDNSVSCTVYYRKEELADIKKWLAINFNNSVKTISFLLHSEHGFVQAPLEAITEAEFLKMSKGTSPITSGGSLNGDEGIDLAECIGGACPIR